jgi:hypothetical protein
MENVNLMAGQLSENDLELLKSYFISSDQHRCTFKSIKEQLIQKGFPKYSDNALGKALKSYATSIIIKRNGTTYRGWFVKFIG